MARVVVWGTGNVGRPAIRAVAAHRDLELAGVIVANPDKVGVDAGALADLKALLRTVARDQQSWDAERDVQLRRLAALFGSAPT